MRRDKTRTQALEQTKKTNKLHNQLTMAKTARDMAKTQRFEGLFKEADKRRIRLETQSQMHALNAETWGTRKLQSERKWISMCDVQAAPEYRKGVFSMKATVSQVEVTQCK